MLVGCEEKRGKGGETWDGKTKKLKNIIKVIIFKTMVCVCLSF